MSRRNFTRLFHEAFGKTPAQFVAEARIAEAQQRLLVPRNSIESIASFSRVPKRRCVQCGFRAMHGHPTAHLPFPEASSQKQW